MTDSISAKQLKRILLSDSELAVLDVREEGIYCGCHLFWASNVPLSVLETRIDSLVPRRDVPMVVYDGGKLSDRFPAHRAQKRLIELGYDDIRILEGGVKGWQVQGYEVFSGLNVPSKAFGEFLLQNRTPPEIDAETLNDRLRRDDDVIVLDSRPFDEYHEMSIPTGINTPGAELVHRVFELAPNPDTDVVVNCAGRTRSIVGAQSLINAGVPNRVMLLKDGTMGWRLAGLDLDHHQSRVAPDPSRDSYAKALEAANRVAKAYGVSFIDHDRLLQWRDDPERTLYVFDVRAAEEYAAGHVHGARHVAGGQLVQTTDEHVAVRGARIVLFDDRAVRAIMTASWLMQMGHADVHVLTDCPASGTSTEPTKDQVLGLEKMNDLSAGELRSAIQSGESVRVVDVSTSREFDKSHIPRASWCIRQYLNSALALLPPTGLLVLTSEDGILAHLAAKELPRDVPEQLVRVLAGGNIAWREAGYPTASGMAGGLCDIDDVWDRPYEKDLGQTQRMQDYLDWEVQLMEQVDRDGTAKFRC